jgi:hypothetical protein
MGDESDVDETSRKAVPSNLANTRTDLLDWIMSVQRSANATTKQPGMGVNAEERWQSSHSDLWLIPCLMSASATQSDCDQLIAAASAVSPSSPAYLTARYNLIRLLIEQKKFEAARLELDKTLRSAASLPPSSRCLLLSQKGEVAKNFDEYWQDVQQVTAACDDAPSGIPEDLKKLDQANNYIHGPTCFTIDGARALNTCVPLRILATAANSVHLDKNVRRDYLQALWTRAVMLGDLQIANQITPLLAVAAPTLTASLHSFTAAGTLQEKRFILACMALSNPAMRPYITPAAQRQTPFNKIDEYQDNWWCKGAISDFYAGYDKNKPRKFENLNFLSAADAAVAKAEFDKLIAAGPGPDYLLGQVIDWAATHPKDARLPEALYRAIRSPKFGCGGKLATGLSKKAFAILHTDFPGNPYTKKTQYWY